MDNDWDGAVVQFHYGYWTIRNSSHKFYHAIHDSWYDFPHYNKMYTGYYTSNNAAQDIILSKRCKRKIIYDMEIGQKFIFLSNKDTYLMLGRKEKFHNDETKYCINLCDFNVMRIDKLDTSVGYLIEENE